MPITEIQVIPETTGSDIDSSLVSSNANYVSNLFTHTLNASLESGIKKILIEVHNSDVHKDKPVSYYRSDSIYIVTSYFDFNCLSILSSDKIIFKLAEHVRIILSHLSSELEWEPDVIEEAFNSIQKNGFDLVIYSSKPKFNKSRKLKAGVLIKYEIDVAKIYLYVTNKEEVEIFRLKIFETVPNSFIYNQLIGEIKWTDNSVFVFYSVSKEIELHIDIFSTSHFTKFNIKDRNIEDVLEELKYLSKDNILPEWIM